ncbi:Holliday junction resolvase RuvX [Candidatus Thalassolituus haligoni]|uniref:Holliday junction resolvase RuvX n=1 Tax=Candidatus Thalassolituus haligoni TaxID=3100113 RepID=UPI003518FD73|tara:strand:- start:12410 stop:12862 length:453 start_codon:yes stop_codon:yes gene_type:complete
MSHIPARVMQVMAFDFGTKRIGVAIGQRLTGSSSALTPLKANDGVPNWDTLTALVNEWQPDAFVVGLPLNMDGSASDMSTRAAKFARRLEGRLHKPSFTHDERLTSYEAKGMVIADSGERDFGRHSVDGLAAQLILESWMGEHPRPDDAQ